MKVFIANVILVASAILNLVGIVISFIALSPLLFCLFIVETPEKLVKWAKSVKEQKL
jgi:hypothetical protein